MRSCFFKQNKKSILDLSFVQKCSFFILNIIINKILKSRDTLKNFDFISFKLDLTVLFTNKVNLVIQF